MAKSYERKVIERKRLPKNGNRFKEILYILRNRPYFDIRIYRDGYEIGNLVCEDDGSELLSIDKLGVFAIPKPTTNYFKKGIKTYLNYDTKFIKAFEPVNPVDPDSEDSGSQEEPVRPIGVKPIHYMIPAITPREYVDLLESQAMADVLSEEVKSNSWIMWLLIAGIIILVLFGIFGSGSV